MSLYATSTSSSKFKPVPGGLFLARCYRVVDLGTQKSEYKGEITFKRKMMIGWELHGEDDSGNPLVTESGEPMAIFKSYNLSWTDKSALRIDLQAWRGTPFTPDELTKFDLKKILDQWCMVNVVQKDVGGKNYSNVESITSVPQMIKKAGLPKGVNACQLFSISDPDMEVFEKLSKNLKEKIENSPEWKSKNSTGFEDMPHELEDKDDDLPF
jgi:hypothetical protein